MKHTPLLCCLCAAWMAHASVATLENVEKRYEIRHELEASWDYRSPLKLRLNGASVSEGDEGIIWSKGFDTQLAVVTVKSVGGGGVAEIANKDGVVACVQGDFLFLKARKPLDGFSAFPESPGKVVKPAGGGLLISCTEPDTRVGAAPSGRYRDFDGTVSARRMGGTADNEFGWLLRCGGGHRDWLSFAASSDGHWRIVRGAGDSEEQIREWQEVEETKGMDGEKLAEWADKPLVLRIVRRGGDFDFYVNGNRVAGGVRGPEGDITPGLFAAAWDKGGARVVFNDFRIEVQ